MSVIPTTRAGYNLGIRRKKIPYERLGSSGYEKFIASRRGPRMAGMRNLSRAMPDFLDAPYGVGLGFTPEDRDVWTSFAPDPGIPGTFPEDWPHVDGYF